MFQRKVVVVVTVWKRPFKNINFVAGAAVSGIQ